MQVLEIIQHKHQKQQLNEALPALLIGAIVTSLSSQRDLEIGSRNLKVM